MKSATENRKPYSGLSRSLVIAIDIGTTFSGVSYAILEPGEIPKIHGVTRFPGQEHVAGNSKIPSVIYYDKHGKMMAAGAEADTASVVSQAEDDGWIKAELFKLRLRPRTMQLNMNGMRLSPLPRRKTAVHVFGDFLAYLYRCTRNFITDTHGNGAALWNAVENDIQFVLSHPNGWEGAQQTKMRRAAVYGGLIPDTNEGKARIRFVTEGEASLHACVLNGLAADVLSNPSKHGFLIADAGGGTLDISAYAIRGTNPLVMEEIAPPDCIFAGSVFVSRRAREFLEEKLKSSKYGTPAALDHITQRFDETTKRLFRERRDLQFIPFGSPLDKDLAVGIRGGQLKLTGNEVANLFEPSVDAAVNAIKAQIEASHGIIRSVFLVGGYAASPWLFNQLQERLAPLSITVSRPDTQTSKAVADGAVGFYCDHHVSARMSKFMYGVEFLRELDLSNPDHVARKERLCELPSGPKLLPDAFDCILNRGVKVKESTVFTRKYCTELTSLSMLSVFEVEIWCYRGGNVIPKWIDRQADDFSTLCVVRADLSPLSGSAEPKMGKNGKTYWTIVFSVEIHFGLTEFRARIKWVDDGKTKYGPASIIYNERGHRADEEEPDTYPEDDVGTSSPRNDRLRSEPASRALTPTEHFYQPPGSSFASEPSPAPEVPAVHRERTPSMSKGRSSTSTPVPPDTTRDLARSAEVEKEKEIVPDTKKGKGKDKTPKGTPKGTPKLEETFSSSLAAATSEKAMTPKLGDTLASLLGTANPSIELSPITSPTDTKPPQANFGATAASSPEEKEEKEKTTPISSKPSPATGLKRSPLATSEPIVAEVAATATPAVPPVSPGAALTPSKTGKKGKKKGSNATTPVVETVATAPATPKPPSPTVAEPPAEFKVEEPVADKKPEAEILPAATLEEPAAKDLSTTEKPASSSLTPLVLPDITPDTAETWGSDAKFVTPADGFASTLFSSSTWGDTLAAESDKDKDKDKDNNAFGGGWGSFGNTANTSTKSPNPDTLGSKTDSVSPKPGASPGWGAGSSKPTVGWGLGASSVPKSAEPKPIWGSSLTPTATTPATRSPFGAKSPASPWGAKPSTSTETPVADAYKPDASPKPPAETSEVTNAPEAEASKPEDKVVTPNAASTELPVTTETKETTEAKENVEAKGTGEAAGSTEPTQVDASSPATGEETATSKPDANTVPTPQTSPKGEALGTPIDPETPVDVTSPTGEGEEDGGDDNAKDKEEPEQATAGGKGKKGGGGGGGGGKGKKKKKK